MKENEMLLFIFIIFYRILVESSRTEQPEKLAQATCAVYSWKCLIINITNKLLLSCLSENQFALYDYTTNQLIWIIKIAIHSNW